MQKEFTDVLVLKSAVEIRELALSSKFIYQPAVADYATIATEYPSPETGWTTQTLDDGKIYRFDGTDWIHVTTVTSGLWDSLSNEITAARKGEDTLEDKIDAIDASLSEITNSKADKVDLAVANSELKKVSNILANANINQESKVTVDGYDTLSLPKTAGEGAMGVEVDGLTARNLINGRGDSLTGWSAGDSLSLSGGYLKAINTIAHNHYFSFAVRNARRYFVTLLGYNEDGAKFNMFLSSGTTAVATAYNPAFTTTPTRFSTILLTTGSGDRIRFVRDGTAGATYIKDFMIIDITELYDAGITNVADYEKIFPSYFDGTKSIPADLRIKSVGKNLEYGEPFSHNSTTPGSFNSTIKVIPNQTIYVKQTVIGTHRTIMQFFDANMNEIVSDVITSPSLSYLSGRWISNLDIPSETTTLTTITANSNIHYLKVGSSMRTPSTSNYIYDRLISQISSTYEPYKESFKYINAPEGEDLKSLPNGVKDTIEGENKVKRVSDFDSIADTDYDSIDLATYTNVAVVKTTAFSSAATGTTGVDGIIRVYNSSGVELLEVSQANIDLTASIGRYYYHTDKTIWFIIGKATYVDIATARTGLGTSTAIFKLATPETIPVASAGYLTSFPSGTVYAEPYTADAGVYDSGFSIFREHLLIDEIETITKVDYTTGIETIINPATAVVDVDFKGFTHPDLSDDDIVFVTYKFAKETPATPFEIEHYDSRYVVADDSDGKFYKWLIKTDAGVAYIDTVEV